MSDFIFIMPTLLHELKLSWQIFFVYKCILHVVESTDLLNATEMFTLNLSENIQMFFLKSFTHIYLFLL